MKKITIISLILLYIFIPITKIKAIEIDSEYAVLYNLNDDEIIYEKNAYEKGAWCARSTHVRSSYPDGEPGCRVYAFT